MYNYQPKWKKLLLRHNKYSLLKYKHHWTDHFSSVLCCVYSRLELETSDNFSYPFFLCHTAYNVLQCCLPHLGNWKYVPCNLCYLQFMHPGLHTSETPEERKMSKYCFTIKPGKYKLINLHMTTTNHLEDWNVKYWWVAAWSNNQQSHKWHLRLSVILMLLSLSYDITQGTALPLKSPCV